MNVGVVIIVANVHKIRAGIEVKVGIILIRVNISMVRASVGIIEVGKKVIKACIDVVGMDIVVLVVMIIRPDQEHKAKANWHRFF